MAQWFTVEMESYPALRLEDAISVRFGLSRDGGMVDADIEWDREYGELWVAGGVGTAALGEAVSIYYLDEEDPPAEHLWWRGFLEEIATEETIGKLTLRCVGWGQRLLNQFYPMQVYGPDADTAEHPGAKTAKTTVAAVVDDLYDTYLAGQPGISLGTIEGSGVSISNLVMRGTRTLYDVLRELAVMGGNLCWGIDQGGVFYFKAPSATTFYTYAGADSFRLTQSVASTYNRLILMGGTLRLGSGAPYLGQFNDAASQALYGLRVTARSVQEIVNDADAEAYATAFFQRWAGSHDNVQLLETAITELPLPWEKQVKVVDEAGEVLTSIAATRVRVSMAESMDAEIGAGEEPTDPWMNFERVVEQEILKRTVITLVNSGPREAEAGEATINPFQAGIHVGYVTAVAGGGWTATGINGTVANGTNTTIAVSAEGTIKRGWTVKMGSEELFVIGASSDGSNTITCLRGVNGTTGAAHSGVGINRTRLYNVKELGQGAGRTWSNIPNVFDTPLLVGDRCVVVESFDGAELDAAVAGAAADRWL